MSSLVHLGRQKTRDLTTRHQIKQRWTSLIIACATVEPTPTYTSVGVDVLKSRHDASSKSAIAHVGANHMAPTAVLSGTFLVLGIQFGRLPRHQRVVEDTLETQNEQSGQTE